jgi:hypothetical protein
MDRTLQGALWPTEADHWVVLVQYEDRTSCHQIGAVPVGGHGGDRVVTSCH